jgi:hypothetical protein
MLREWAIDRSSRRAADRQSLPEQTPAVVLRAARGGRRKGPNRIPIYLDNVSISGVGFYAPALENLRYGDVMTLEVDGLRSSIRLRRVKDSTGSEWTYCGAAFLDGAPAVMPAFERLFNGGVDLSGRVLRWEHAHLT